MAARCPPSYLSSIYTPYNIQNTKKPFYLLNIARISAILWSCCWVITAVLMVADAIVRVIIFVIIIVQNMKSWQRILYMELNFAYLTLASISRETNMEITVTLFCHCTWAWAWSKCLSNNGIFLAEAFCHSREFLSPINGGRTILPEFPPIPYHLCYMADGFTD